VTLICGYSGDSVATALSSLAMDEKLNETAKTSIADFASHFAAVQDYEESEVVSGLGLTC